MIGRPLWQNLDFRAQKERAAEATLSYLRPQRLVIADMRPAALERTVSKPDAKAERVHLAPSASKPFCQGIETEATQDGGLDIAQLSRIDLARHPLSTLIATPPWALETVKSLKRNR